MNSFAKSMLAAVVMLGAGTAHGDLLVDFNDRGFNVISPTLSGWEGFALGPAGQTATPTYDVTSPVERSFAGGIDVTVSRIVVSGSPVIRDNNYDPGPQNSGSFTQANMMRDFINASNTATGEGLNILVEGLIPNAQYEGRIWSYDPAHATLPANWNIFDADWYANGTQFANDVSLAGPLPTNNTDYSYAFSTVANANGEIVIRGLRDAASIGNPVLINGLQLTLVPEPASTAIVGFGTLCLLGRRRASRQA